MNNTDKSEYVEIEYLTIDNCKVTSFSSWLKTVVSHTYDTENHIGRFSIPRGAAIEAYAFQYSNLKSIRIPDGVVKIGNGAFSSCSNLTNITIPDSVSEIEDAAFYGCSSLTSITIPKNVKRIRGEAFKNCRNLESLTITNEATRICVSAFSGCVNLKTITIAGKVAKEGDSEFPAAKQRLFRC